MQILGETVIAGLEVVVIGGAVRVKTAQSEREGRRSARLERNGGRSVLERGRESPGSGGGWRKGKGKGGAGEEEAREGRGRKWGSRARP